MAMDDLIDSCTERVQDAQVQGQYRRMVNDTESASKDEGSFLHVIAPSCITVPKGGKRSILRASGRAKVMCLVGINVKGKEIPSNKT